MPIDPFSDAKILDSWHVNAEAWTAAVRERQIESRRLVTDRAILEAIAERAPRTMLDLGCGEGWLTRAACERGIRSTGIDAIPALIDNAAAKGGGVFLVRRYEALGPDAFDAAFDAVVANFSLLGASAVECLVRAVPAWLTPKGALLIQTLHPHVAVGEGAYEDGWRPGSWAGFSSAFTDPAPWYFRTLESWVRLLSASGLKLVRLVEPLHPTTRQPASVILVAEKD